MNKTLPPGQESSREEIVGGDSPPCYELSEEADVLQASIDLLKAASQVQSVLCSRERFKTAEEARKWVTSHGFSGSKVDTTDQYYRFRQFDPSLCSTTPKTITLTKGVKAIICQKK